MLAEEAVVMRLELDGTAAAVAAVQEALRLSPHKRWVTLNIQ